MEDHARAGAHLGALSCRLKFSEDRSAPRRSNYPECRLRAFLEWTGDWWRRKCTHRRFYHEWDPAISSQHRRTGTDAGDNRIENYLSSIWVYFEWAENGPSNNPCGRSGCAECRTCRRSVGSEFQITDQHKLLFLDWSSWAHASGPLLLRSQPFRASIPKRHLPGHGDAPRVCS